MERMYFDHAATTPLDKEVLLAMTPYLTECFGNADSPHSFGRNAMKAVDLSRDKIAELIGAKPNEIYFTSGGTESDNWAFMGGARAKRKEGKTRVVLSAIEHHALLFSASELEKEGLSGGAIAGITAGSATALGAGGFSLFWFVIKKKKWSDLFKKK